MTFNKLIQFKFVMFILFSLMMSFFIVNISFAEPNIVSTPSDLSRELTQAELDNIASYKDLQEMVGQIFEINTYMGTNDLSNPINLMLSLVSQVLYFWNGNEEKGIPAFTATSLYHLLVGLAFIFLVANFSVKMYEESSAGVDLKINSNLMLKKYVQFIFAILIIFNIKSIVLFVLGFFRFVLKLCINVTDANFIVTPENIDVLNAKTIAYEILASNEIVEKNTLLDEVIVRSKESAVRAQYMIPWVFSWVSKLALVVVIFINSIKLFIHSAFYIVTVGDFFVDIRKSKFIEYTKTLIALVLEEAVIVAVLYLSNILLNPYLRDLLMYGIKPGGISFLTLAMIFNGVSMSKVFVIIGSSQISKKIVGVA